MLCRVASRGLCGLHTEEAKLHCWYYNEEIGNKKDDVNSPSHYNQGKIEVSDFIEDQKFGFFDGNVVKYLCRYKHKGNALKDLKKAQWYLEKLIKIVVEGIE